MKKINRKEVMYNEDEGLIWVL